ncbi:MAG: GntR family transcriptional regulator [Anaerolineae bacterium]|nr:GntR family transcriptional regulator [Anaerolineae bacterium]
MSAVPTKKEQVYVRIRRAIISGDLTPGAILNESEIAAKFESGKTPTREALILLTHENFLEALPRVGYIVTKPTLQDILETFHLRLILEVEAIGLGVGRISPEEIGHLEKNIQEEELLAASFNPEQKDRASAINRDFHLVIARTSGNNRLMKYIQQLIDDMERTLVNDPYLADPNQHKKILEALLSKDNKLAKEAMYSHIEETRNRIVNRF